MIYETFSDSLDEAVSLLKLSTSTRIGKKQAQLVLRSSVVLSVAFWQNYHESYVKNMAGLIKRRCSDSAKLPKVIRDKVAQWVMETQKKKMTKPEKCGKLMWEFAEGKWNYYYGTYVENVVLVLNTPNTKNINALYVSVLGLNEIANSWSNRIGKKSPSESIDYILDTRHEIAHGNFDRNLSYEQAQKMIECLRKNAKQSYDRAFLEAVKIMESSGTPYSLDSFNLSGLIKWLAKNPTKIPFAVAKLPKEDNKWYANHRKLSHISWSLLEGPVKARKTTQRFRQFIDGQLSLPYEIISFGGEDSMPKPGTKMVYFKNL